MEACSWVPLETSFLIRWMASRYTALPVAPATESNASTKGTPAANVVERTRPNLATADLSRISPITGSLSTYLSTKSENEWERRLDSLKRNMLPTMPMSTTNHQLCSHSEILITSCVKTGSSAPKPLNSSSNCGTTFTRSMAVTMIATTTTAIGYVMAFLTFFLRISVFSR